MKDIDTSFSAKNRLSKAIEAIKKPNFSPITSESTLYSLQSALSIIPTPPNLSGFCAFAERVVGWIPLNPNDIHRIRAIVSAYHLPNDDDFNPETSTLQCPHPITIEYTRSKTNFIPNYRLPTKEGLIALFDAINNDTNQFIALSGRRGSGKTMALNFFLATAHRPLSSKGVLWFRTDVAKLWMYKRSFLNLTQYTILHSIYVGLRYADQDSNLGALTNNGELFTNHLATLAKTEKSAKKTYSVWADLVEGYSKAHRIASKDPHGKPASEFLSEGKKIILKPGGSDAVQDVYKELIAFLRDFAHKKGETLRILIILDGVDNIRIEAEQDRYFDFLTEINRLVSSEYPLKIGDKFLLVARPETFSDLVYLRTTMPNGQYAPLLFHLDTDFIPDLLKKKSAAIEHPVEYFQKAAEIYTGKRFIDSDQSRSFAQSIKYLLSMFDTASKSVTLSTISSNKPIDLIFDGNIRSLLRNTIRAHHHRIRLSKVSYVRTLLEGSVLAGCNSMPGNFDDTVHGHWCPNLFEIATVQDGHWTGLTMIRLIQLLGVVKDGVSKTDAISFAQQTFGYSELQCQTAFQMALEFSLIRSNGNRPVAFDEKMGRPRNTRIYTTTPKGHYLLKLAFEDYATFYFMAVSTPLNLKYLQSKGIDLQLMTHSVDHLRHFYRAALLAGFVLWAHIRTADQQERNAFENVLLVCNGKAVPAAAFDLPGIDAWTISAENLLLWLPDRDRQLVLTFFDRYVPIDEPLNAS